MDYCLVRVLPTPITGKYEEANYENVRTINVGTFAFHIPIQDKYIGFIYPITQRNKNKKVNSEMLFCDLACRRNILFDFIE